MPGTPKCSWFRSCRGRMSRTSHSLGFPSGCSKIWTSIFTIILAWTVLNFNWAFQLVHTCTRTCLKNVLPELVHHHVHSVITLQASDVVVNVFVEYRLNFLAEIVEAFVYVMIGVDVPQWCSSYTDKCAPRFERRKKTCIGKGRCVQRCWRLFFLSKVWFALLSWMAIDSNIFDYVHELFWNGPNG